MAVKGGLQGTAPGSQGEEAGDSKRHPAHCRLRDKDRGLGLTEEEEAG